MASKHYRLLPTDTIRANPSTSKIKDGMRVADVPRGLLLAHLRAGRMTLERNGEPMKIDFLPPRPRGLDGKCSTYARREPSAPRDEADDEPPRPPPKRRDCLCCGGSLLSTGPHHRLCDVCRRQNEW